MDFKYYLPVDGDNNTSLGEERDNETRSLVSNK